MFYLSRRDEAVARFVGRVSVCSEAQEHFGRDNFAKNFGKYYARRAFSKERKERLGEFMSDENVRRAMETINEGLKRFDIKWGCIWTNFKCPPFIFWRNLLSSILILGGFGWMTARSGFDPVMLLGIVPAAVILVYALRYDWL